MLPILETKRLRMRPPTWDDLDSIYRLGSNPNVMRFLNKGEAQTIGQARKDLERRIRQTNQYTGYWITEQKTDHAFVGWIALKRLEQTKDTEIGYRFLEEFWGKGLATEAGTAVLSYAFKALDLPKVVAITVEANLASVRVMEKLGLSQTGTGVYYNTQCVYYEISKEKYSARA